VLLCCCGLCTVSKEVIGIVRRGWNSLIRDERCDVDIFMEANCVRVTNDLKSSVVVLPYLVLLLPFF
jgi:hypothetical protein